MLNGIVAGAVAVIAGADGPIAVRLAVAMTALQLSIGALNDIVDAPTDAVGAPSKADPGRAWWRRPWHGPSLSGERGSAWLLAATTGFAVTVIAVAGLAIGYGYDLRFKGTIWSWVPFAVGIPLVPVFGWLGGAGRLPDAFTVLIPMAVLAGAAIAVANARADIDRDRTAGVDSVAARLGDRRAWAVNAVVLAIVIAIALGSLWARPAEAIELVAAIGAVAVIAVGVVAGVRPGRLGRQRPWEIEAVGLGLLAAVWLAGVRL